MNLVKKNQKVPFFVCLKMHLNAYRVRSKILFLNLTALQCRPNTRDKGKVKFLRHSVFVF